MSRPLPGNDVPVVDPKTGMMTQTWYEYFSYVSSLNLPAFAKGAPVNGQILAYSSVTGKFSLQPVVAQANNQVLIWNSGSGTWVAGAN